MPIRGLEKREAAAKSAKFGMESYIHKTHSDITTVRFIAHFHLPIFRVVAPTVCGLYIQNIISENINNHYKSLRSILVSNRIYEKCDNE